MNFGVNSGNAEQGIGVFCGGGPTVPVVDLSGKIDNGKREFGGRIVKLRVDDPESEHFATKILYFIEHDVGVISGLAFAIGSFRNGRLLERIPNDGVFPFDVFVAVNFISGTFCEIPVMRSSRFADPSSDGDWESVKQGRRLIGVSTIVFPG